jgi:hypothetical protein
MQNSDKKYDNSGALFKNDRKADERDRDYSGSITVAGVEYWLSGWIKEGRNGKFLSLAVKPKDAPAGKPKPKANETAAASFDDGIGF